MILCVVLTTTTYGYVDLWVKYVQMYFTLNILDVIDIPCAASCLKTEAVLYSSGSV